MLLESRGVYLIGVHIFSSFLITMPIAFERTDMKILVILSKAAKTIALVGLVATGIFLGLAYNGAQYGLENSGRKQLGLFVENGVLAEIWDISTDKAFVLGPSYFFIPSALDHAVKRHKSEHYFICFESHWWPLPLTEQLTGGGWSGNLKYSYDFKSFDRKRDKYEKGKQEQSWFTLFVDHFPVHLDNHEIKRAKLVNTASCKGKFEDLSALLEFTVLFRNHDFEKGKRELRERLKRRKK